MNEAIRNMDIRSILILIIILFTFITGNIIFTLYIFHILKDKKGPNGIKGKTGDSCKPYSYVIKDMVSSTAED